MLTLCCARQDLSSAHYDPKSRSMREDPQPNRPDQEKSFKGDNFIRQNGDFAVRPVLTCPGACTLTLMCACCTIPVPRRPAHFSSMISWCGAEFDSDIGLALRIWMANEQALSRS